MGRWVIVTTVCGSAMASLDSTVVGIALPVIGRQFRAGVAGLQWVVTGYLLTLSGLLLLGGVLGDRFGRRRIFLIGVVWFALASALCGLAPDLGVLVAARLLQGVGGALLMPGSLAILQAVFVPGDRGRAIGAWSGFAGIATAIGPFLGGYLISAVSWRLIFFINLPLAGLVVVLGRRYVPESSDPAAPRRIDLGGALLATGGLVGFTYGLIEGPPLGWRALGVLASLTCGGIALLAFVLVEKRQRHPLLPLKIFASPQFTGANLLTLAVYGALAGALFLLPIELEQVGRYSPLRAGASLLPVTALMLVLSPRFGALSGRLGPRGFLGSGPLVVAAGFALLARLGPGAPYLEEVFPAVCVIGFGLSLTVAPLTTTVLAAAPGEHSGVASAINNDVARTAGLVAVAVLPAAVGLSGASYLHPALFNLGFHHAVLVCAGACVLGGVVGFATKDESARRSSASPQACALPLSEAAGGPGS